MRKDSTARKLRALTLNRETLYALSNNELHDLAAGISLRCEGTAECTASCGAASCAYTCANGYLACTA
jgi:hypothetical protein